MSKTNEFYRAQLQTQQALLSQQREVDKYPDFNQWVIELENDPDYLEKVEKRLDSELGEDRLF